MGEKRVAAGYGWPLSVDPEVVRFFKLIKPYLKNARALDIGCGQGRHTFFFAEQEVEAYGIDYIARSIEEAKALAINKKLKNTHFQVMDLLNLDFPKDFFDIVLDWSVLDHIHPDEWQTYLQNILKVLKIGGYLMLTEFGANDSRISNKKENYRWDRGSYDHYFREEELRKLFSKNFTFVEITETELGTPPPHIMINVLAKRRL